MNIATNRKFDQHKNYDKNNLQDQISWSVENKKMNRYFKKDNSSQRYNQKYSGNDHQSRKSSYFKDNNK